MSSHHSDPVASVVIPAYNEGKVIGRCLSALTAPGTPPLEIVVAANGCHDDTVAVARTFAGVRVLDIPLASKANALVEGDHAATTLPRIYLDADIELSLDALPALIKALDTPKAVVAAPQVQFDTDSCSWPVQAFYDVYRQTPYVRSGLVGLGVYGLSAAGRARFDTFPALQADDLFIQRIFAPHERLTTNGRFVVRAPRDLRNLIKVRTRIARGNAELASSDLSVVGELRDDASTDFSASTGSTSAALLNLVRSTPTAIPGVLTYASVVTAARLRASRAKDSRPAWHRDDSTR